MLYPDLPVLIRPQQFPLLLRGFSLPLNLISPPPILIFPAYLPFSPWYPAPPSPLSPSLFSGPTSSVVCPPDLCVPWFQLFYVINCSFLFTGSFILAFVLPWDFCPWGSSGLVWPKKSASGQGHVSAASRARFRSMCTLQVQIFQFPGVGFLTCTWT